MRRSILLGVIAAMAASCTVQEADVLMDERTETVFYATFEQPEEDTKVYANEKLLIRWHEDDRLSIFNKLTYNQQYQFTGKTGDNSGGFRKVDGDEFVTGNTLNDIVAVYPYQQGTSIAEDEVLSVELPAEQVYAHNTFGRGANAMVSVSSGNVLMFKNVGAYLMFSLYGEGVSVSSITLRGNNGEKLSGKAYVTMPLNGVPSTQVVGDAADASGTITLRCEEPVALGASASECTAFWFVVPPVTFSRGFTITITQSNGGTVEKSTSRSVVLTRNKLSKMAPMEVEKAAAPEPEAVDLGLPSGLKWASWNVGASAPEEYGDYFAWGETEPYYEAGYAQSESPVWKSGKESGYYWPSYKWYNGAGNKLTKYCTWSYYWDGTGPMDNKTVLDPEDDAAHVNWGGSWRMPTFAECKELHNNCTWTWTTQNGVNGRKVTGPNGKSIFLPAAGCYRYDRYDASLDYVGSLGHYWSSSLWGDPSCAYYVDFISGKYGWYGGYRNNGFSVRPVYGEFIPVSSISLERSSLELTVYESYTLSATISPSNATEKTIHWYSSDSSVATVDANGLVTASGAGTVTITAYGSSGVSAECTVTVEAVPLSAPDDVEAVDLGLPSGLKWASCNVGATKPEEYGAYFAWGETEPKSNYDWLTYKWSNGEYNKLTKYCTNSDYYNDYWDGIGPMDNKTVLDLEDDAAHVNWGGSWRMPTDAEWTELRTECTWTWTTQGGKNGYKVTSKTTGNSIFLPAAGYRHYTELSDVGSYGYYWSSSLYTGGPLHACFVNFYSGYYDWGIDLRCNGFSVRPVSE